MTPEMPPVSTVDLPWRTSRDFHYPVVTWEDHKLQCFGSNVCPQPPPLQVPQGSCMEKLDKRLKRQKCPVGLPWGRSSEWDTQLWALVKFNILIHKTGAEQQCWKSKKFIKRAGDWRCLNGYESSCSSRGPKFGLAPMSSCSQLPVTPASGNWTPFFWPLWHLHIQHVLT